MKRLPRRFRDDSSSRIGTYEAFLDLLTLFCFILMFAAAIHVAKPTTTGTAQVSAQDARRGVPPGQLSTNAVELKVSSDGPTNRLTVLDGPQGLTLEFQLTNSDVGSLLASIESSLGLASNIHIAVFEDSQLVDAEVLVAIQRWLANNGFGHYQFDFVEPR